LVGARNPRTRSKREDILKIDPSGVYAVLLRKHAGEYQEMIDEAEIRWNTAIEGFDEPLQYGADFWTNFKGATEQKMSPEQLDEAIGTLADAEDFGFKVPAQLFIATDGQRRVAVDTQGYEYWRYKGIIIPQASELIKLAHGMLQDNDEIKYLSIEEGGKIMAGYDSAGNLVDDIDIEKDFHFKE
jgi:hypothetical protein